MSGTAMPLSISETQSLAWTLLHFLWQGALVALALAGALALTRHRSANLRYALALGALLAMPLLPVLTLTGRLKERGVPAAAVAPSIPADPARTAVSHGAVPVAAPPVRPDLREAVEPFLPGFVAFWVVGVALLSLYQVGGWLLVRRWTRQGTRPPAAIWESRLAELRRRLGVTRAVRLLESSRIAVPAVVGWLRPVILLPASALSGLTPAQLETILAHELAHVRRHDFLINLLQAAVETLLFYHPAVWWVSRQVREERENCCDDLALSVCGDRLTYARALESLEGLRTPEHRWPNLAQAAAGGSLLARIRRIAGQPAPMRPSSWLAGVAALALLVTGAVARPSSVAAAAAPAPAAAAPAAAPAQAPAEKGAVSGSWTAERKKDGIWLQMSVREKEGRSSHSSVFPERELAGLGAGPEVRFTLRRDAGTFHFEGRFEGSGPGAQGAGLFRFEGDPSYVREMASLGHRLDQKDLLQLAMLDLSLAYVRELRALGYSESLDRLVEMRIHGVTPAYIRSLADLGYRGLAAEKLVELSIHGVSPDSIRGMADLGYADLPADKLVELQIHGVDPEFVRLLADAGYRDLPVDKLVEMQIHGVGPEYIRELAEAGYPHVAPDDLVSLRIHGVDEGFIREMEQKGHRNLSVDDLISLRIHGGWRP